MNKKGYTLIELIGVIVVISLMVLLVSTISDKTVKEAQEKTEKSCKQNAIIAAHNWTLDNKDKIENEIVIKISELTKEGYLDKKDCLEKVKCIKIEKNKKGTKAIYNYSPTKNC